MTQRRWRRTDPLFRGDGQSVGLPSPEAEASIVRHVLFLGGRGRETPYLSTSELADRAALFAGGEGVVWKTWVARAEARGVRHVSARDLQQLLRGAGKGAAAWPTPWEVMRARQLVELHREHLLDFSEHSRDRAELRAAVDSMFERERR